MVLDGGEQTEHATTMEEVMSSESRSNINSAMQSTAETANGLSGTDAGDLRPLLEEFDAATRDLPADRIQKFRFSASAVYANGKTIEKAMATPEAQAMMAMLPVNQEKVRKIGSAVLVLLHLASLRNPTTRARSSAEDLAKSKELKPLLSSTVASLQAFGYVTGEQVAQLGHGSGGAVPTGSWLINSSALIARQPDEVKAGLLIGPAELAEAQRVGKALLDGAAHGAPTAVSDSPSKVPDLCDRVWTWLCEARLEAFKVGVFVWGDEAKTRVPPLASAARKFAKPAPSPKKPTPETVTQAEGKPATAPVPTGHDAPAAGPANGTAVGAAEREPDYGASGGLEPASEGPHLATHSQAAA